MKQVEVSILGQVYMLGCPEGGETLLGVAVQAVDHEMTQIRQAGKVRARERIAVLAALNLGYQLAALQAAQKAAPAPAAAQSPAIPADEHPLVESMLRRIDAALGDDGQLL